MFESPGSGGLLQICVQRFCTACTPSYFCYFVQRLERGCYGVWSGKGYGNTMKEWISSQRSCRAAMAAKNPELPAFVIEQHACFCTLLIKLSLCLSKLGLSQCCPLKGSLLQIRSFPRVVMQNRAKPSWYAPAGLEKKVKDDMEHHRRPSSEGTTQEVEPLQKLKEGST